MTGRMLTLVPGGPGPLPTLADAQAGQAGELARLRSVWGDVVEDIRVEAGQWRGRWRSGDGGQVAADTAAGLDAALRAGEIIRLYRDERLSMAKVADKTGTSFARVRRVIEQAGAARRRRPDVGEREARAIVAACTTGGMSRTQAAQRFGRAASTVDKLLNRAALIPADGGDLLRAGQAAEVAGVTKETLRLYASRGLIGSVRPTAHGQHWYYRADAEAIAARRTGQEGTRQ